MCSKPPAFLSIHIYLLTVLRSQLSYLASFEKFFFKSGCSFIMCFTLSKMFFLWFIFLPPEESILPSGVMCHNCTFWVGDFVYFQFSIYTKLVQRLFVKQTVEKIQSHSAAFNIIFAILFIRFLLKFFVYFFGKGTVNDYK